MTAHRSSGRKRELTERNNTIYTLVRKKEVKEVGNDGGMRKGWREASTNSRKEMRVEEGSREARKQGKGKRMKGRVEEGEREQNKKKRREIWKKVRKVGSKLECKQQQKENKEVKVNNYVKKEGGKEGREKREIRK